MNRGASAFVLFFLLFFVHQPTGTLASEISASCASCIQNLAKPVVFGCVENEPLYLTFNGTKLPCGSAITLEQGMITPEVHYTDAKNDTLYSILLVDTTGTDPSESLQPPFMDYPLLLYGALNVPGNLLKDGMTMKKYVYDGTQVLVKAFQEYIAPNPPTPNEVPGFEPMDITIMPFNYELMVGEQFREVGDNEPPDYTEPIRFDFYYVLSKLAPVNKVSSYFSSGACVVEVDAGNEVPCDIKTEKGESAFDMEAWKNAMGLLGDEPSSSASLHQMNVLLVSSVVSLAALVLSFVHH
jgi:hypothetical protein